MGRKGSADIFDRNVKFKIIATRMNVIRHRASGGPMAASADQDVEMNTMSTIVSAQPNPAQAELIEAVKLDILGAPHQGWRQFFYMLDPFKQGLILDHSHPHY